VTQNQAEYLKLGSRSNILYGLPLRGIIEGRPRLFRWFESVTADDNSSNSSLDSALFKKLYHLRRWKSWDIPSSAPISHVVASFKLTHQNGQDEVQDYIKIMGYFVLRLKSGDIYSVRTALIDIGELLAKGFRGAWNRDYAQSRGVLGLSYAEHFVECWAQAMELFTDDNEVQRSIKSNITCAFDTVFDWLVGENADVRGDFFGSMLDKIAPRIHRQEGNPILQDRLERFKSPEASQAELHDIYHEWKITVFGGNST